MIVDEHITILISKVKSSVDLPIYSQQDLEKIEESKGLFEFVSGYRKNRLSL